MSVTRSPANGPGTLSPLEPNKVWFLTRVSSSVPLFVALACRKTGPHSFAQVTLAAISRLRACQDVTGTVSQVLPLSVEKESGKRNSDGMKGVLVNHESYTGRISENFLQLVEKLYNFVAQGSSHG
jgi:hypothetical protein